MTTIQLSFGSQSRPAVVPTRVPGLPFFNSLSLTQGALHSCMSQGGSYLGWGPNSPVCRSLDRLTICALWTNGLM